MNKLKTGKGALKDYHRCLADEYDDYAEEPKYYDPIPHFTTDSNEYPIQNVLSKSKPGKLPVKMTFLRPKFKPDFNFVTSSGGVFNQYFGERLATYLKVSDIVKLQRTCRYLYKVFTKASIWKDIVNKYYRDTNLSNEVLSSINIMQYAKSLRCSTYGYALLSNEQKKNHDGIVFDTLVIEKDMRKEDKYLARNIVDSVTAKSQKTIDTITKTALAGTFTEDVKISWMKDLNQICVWVAGYNIQSNKRGAFVSDHLNVFACILFNKKYEAGLIQKAYFLNDRFFVIEIEETKEEEFSLKTLEVYVLEPENDWFEKKNLSLCKQVLKETFGIERAENVLKVKNIGDFLVFVLEREDEKLCVQVLNDKGECLARSEDLVHLDSGGLSEVIQTRSAEKNSFRIYLLDKKSEVYILNYGVESGVAIKKIDPKKTSKEEENKEIQTNQRFSETIKKYQYGVYQKIDKEYPSRAFEYLMVFKERKFYMMNLNLKTNELVYCDLLGYQTDSKLFNWTICGEYLYLLIDTTIQVYQLDFNFCCATLIKKEKITFIFRGSSARWILVNPCMTIIVSASSFDESLMSSLQVFIGSTQDLLRKRMGWGDDLKWDQFRLENILGKIEKWQDVSSLGKETIECKFEDERLLIQTNVRSYFRDFGFCERRVEKKDYEWKDGADYDLSEPVGDTEPASENVQQNSTKKSDMRNLVVKENKNHGGKMNKNGNHNWKNVEKKEETEEKLEKKENKKKGDKYYKNVRQGKNREKMFD